MNFLICWNTDPTNTYRRDFIWSIIRKNNEKKMHMSRVKLSSFFFTLLKKERDGLHRNPLYESKYGVISVKAKVGLCDSHM